MSAAGAQAGVLRAQPIRHPDSSDRTVMTRRAWWLVVIGFLIPGSAQVLAGNRRLGRFGLAATIVMWVLVALAILAALFWRPAVYFVATTPWAMLVVQAIMIGYALLWVVLGLNTLVLVRLVRTGTKARYGVAALAVALLVASTGTAAYAAKTIDVARIAVGAVFTADEPPQPPSDGYYNILLLGADSGDGRDGMRFDSISVVSINADSGAVTITGIPRDMKDVPFSPGPMHDLYPNGHEEHDDAECGWSSAINQLNTEVELCRADENLYPTATEHSSTPGIEATRDAAQGVTGLKIQYYAFVDMDHFAAMIDALGGVDINVTERLPKGGGPSYDGEPAEDWAIGWIEAGQQHMDGDTAQWYARSRYTTSDWDRMLRQRILQEAILKQFTPQNVLTHFQDVAAAGTDMVDTDIPASMVPAFLDLGVKAKSQKVQTVELTPEGAGIDPEYPDFDQVHQIIQQALHPKKQG